MHNLVYGEFLKLKRSKMFLLVLLGSLTAPTLTFISFLKNHIENPANIFAFKDLFDQGNLFIALLFGMVVYVVLAAYLFSREYSEHTLKTIISVPVSRTKFIISKYITFFIMVMILTTIAWLGTLILGILGGASGLTFNILTISFIQFYSTAILLYLTLSPFVFITLLMKNLVLPIVAAAAITLGNLIIFGDKWAALYPWSSVYLLATNTVATTGYGLYVPLLVVLATFLTGFIASYAYFKKADVKL
ncbi:ABC transporter permease [Methanobacterium alcaliphilum]|uniref:ABC transporter permease n=1 Tax=Methanobacterium alcaliphilum TaxID=392018 RepID=UPI00200AA427|nr:ABC transporter permease [Methanobacterium alcaliphilum]MCK9151871.1 ABC transporter permease [Methanobacterium alcaliphilum]